MILQLDPERFLPHQQGQKAKLSVLPFPYTPVNSTAQEIPLLGLALVWGGGRMASGLDKTGARPHCSQNSTLPFWPP